MAARTSPADAPPPLRKTRIMEPDGETTASSTLLSYAESRYDYVQTCCRQRGKNEHHRTHKRIIRWCNRNLLILLLLISLILGVTLGLLLRKQLPNMSKRSIMYLNFPGELLMRMLTMLILPLITSSLISGVATLDVRRAGKMGARAVAYYLISTLVAVFLGIVVVSAIKPGQNFKRNTNSTSSLHSNLHQKFENVNPIDSLLDLIRNFFPDNLVEASFQTQKTVARNDTMGREDIKLVPAPGTNILGIVVFSIMLGAVTSLVGNKGKPVKHFFVSLNSLIMVIIGYIIWYSPIGILFLIAAKIAEMDDPKIMVQQLGYYFLTVIVGLVVHGAIILPVTYMCFVRKNPMRYIRGVSECLLTALVTSSSSATLPVTIKCVELNNNIPSRVSRFVLPIGATVNMNGTALYEAIAAVFVAQVNNIHLNIGHLLIVSITATAASIGAAGIPQAGMVTMAVVMVAVGLPVSDLSLIIAIDWLLDRFRTVINVFGDTIGCAVVTAMSDEDIQNEDKSNFSEEGEAETANYSMIASSDADVTKQETETETLNYERDRNLATGRDQV